MLTKNHRPELIILTTTQLQYVNLQNLSIQHFLVSQKRKLFSAHQVLHHIIYLMYKERVAK